MEKEQERRRLAVVGGQYQENIEKSLRDQLRLQLEGVIKEEVTQKIKDELNSIQRFYYSD